MLRCELQRVSFRVSQDLLQTMTKIKPLLAAGSGSVASCTDLAILAQLMQQACHSPKILAHSFCDNQEIAAAEGQWLMHHSFTGIKYSGAWPDVSQLFNTVLEEYVSEGSCVARCSHPPGLKWQYVGVKKPTQGRELANSELAAALETAMVKDMSLVQDKSTSRIRDAAIQGEIELLGNKWDDVAILDLHEDDFIETKDGSFFIPKPGRRCLGGFCCKHHKMQQLLGFVIYNYCLPTPDLTAKSVDQDRLIQQAIYETQDRLAHISLLFAENSFHFFDPCDSSIEYSLVVSMLDFQNKTIVWYDESQLPMKKYGKLVKVELSAHLSFQLHVKEKIEDAGKLKDHMLVLNLRVKEDDGVNPLMQRRTWGGGGWSSALLPGIGIAEDKTSGKQLKASLEDFVSAFELALAINPVTLLSQMSPQASQRIVEILVHFLCGSAPESLAPACAQQALIDLLHALVECGQELAVPCLLRCDQLLGNHEILALLNGVCTRDQLSLLERSCTACSGTQPGELTRYLLGHGAILQLSAPRRTGFHYGTALHVAAAHGQLASVEVLLDWGSLLNSGGLDSRGRSALYLTLTGCRGSWQQIANLLLSYGADFQNAHDGHSSCIQIALMFLGDWLASRRWDLITQTKHVHLASLPLHVLAERGDDEAQRILSKLLAGGADPNCVRLSMRRETALHLAACQGETNFAQSYKSAEILRANFFSRGFFLLHY